jgi:hypothetical protein
MRRESKWRRRVFSPRSLKRQAPAPLGGRRWRRSLARLPCLATRLHNFPEIESFLRKRHFFMVPSGEVASPLSTAPAVPAPWVLASFGEGLELPVVVPVAPFFIAAPPVVVLLFISSHKRAAPRPCEKTCCDRHGRCGEHGSIGCAGLSQGGIPLSAQRRATKRRSSASARTSVASRAPETIG